MKHQLYSNQDLDAPDFIKDRNGDVVLALCKICGRGEHDLEKGCIKLPIWFEKRGKTSSIYWTDSISWESQLSIFPNPLRIYRITKWIYPYDLIRWTYEESPLNSEQLAHFKDIKLTDPYKFQLWASNIIQELQPLSAVSYYEDNSELP